MKEYRKLHNKTLKYFVLICISIIAGTISTKTGYNFSLFLNIFVMLFIFVYLFKIENANILIDPVVAFIMFYLFLNLIGTLFIDTFQDVLFISEKVVNMFNLGIIAFIFGSIFYKKVLLKGYRPRIKTVVISGQNVDVELKVAKLIFIIGMILTVFYFMIVGGIPFLMADADNMRVVLKQGIGYLFIIIYSSFFSSIIFISSYYYYEGKSIKVVKYLVLSSIMIFGIGYRGQAVKVLLASYIIYQIIKNNKIKIVNIISYSILLLFVLGVIGIYRQRGTWDFFNFHGLWLVNRWRFFVNIYNTQMVVSALDGIKLYGKSMIMDISTLLPGYQPSFNIWLKEFLNLNFSGGGLTSTLVGELYFNFGSVGIFATMSMLGGVIAHIKYKYLKHEISLVSLCYLTLISITTTSLISSSLFSALLYDIIPNIIMYKIIISISAQIRKRRQIDD